MIAQGWELGPALCPTGVGGRGALIMGLTSLSCLATMPRHSTSATPYAAYHWAGPWCNPMLRSTSATPYVA